MMAPATVLIGTYSGGSGPGGASQGVYAAGWDGTSGTLGPLRLVAALKHPSFLALHPTLPVAYAVSEVAQSDGQPGGVVAALRLAGDAVTRAGTWPTLGAGPCHVVVDPRGEYLVVSNYSSGTAVVWPLVAGLPAGEPTPLTLEGHGPDPERQEGPHAHSACCEPGGDRFWVQDLGTDRLWGYAFDRTARTARPLAPAWTALAPGCGPRHMAFHPNGRWTYVINELNSTVVALALDHATGRLAPFSTAATLPADVPASFANYCADLHVTADGAFLYGSNRGHDSLAVWRIAPADGRLTPVQHVASGGKHPRNFTLSPDDRWLLCANMQSDTIAVYRRDPKTGRLEPVASALAPQPTCLLFVPTAAR